MLKHLYVMNFVNSIVNEQNIVSGFDVHSELLLNHTYTSCFFLENLLME